MTLFRHIKRFGWRPDMPDHRDLLFLRSKIPLLTLPTAVDLRPHDSPLYDQGDLGSCTGNAVAAAMQFERRRQALPDFIPSRLMIYYDERAIEGTIEQDAGAEIRDGIKSVAKQGACDEALWPYDTTKFAMKPSAQAYTAAAKDRAVKYLRINNSRLDDMRACLAGGYPFVMGFSVYESFMKIDASGVMSMPAKEEEQEGGHAVMAVGYLDNEAVHYEDGLGAANGGGWLIIRNSWGDAWGKKGYFFMPYAYATNINLCDDFWTIRLVSA